MSSNLSFRDFFNQLIKAYEDGDEEAIGALKDKLLSSGKSFRIDLEEDVDWQESTSESYTECPVIYQSFSVFLGDELVYEGEREFGSELEDPTHTGLGGRWITIRIDDEDVALVEEILSDFGLEIDWPVARPWR